MNLKIFLPLVIGMSILLTGCNSTPIYRTVSVSEISPYNTLISDFKSGEYLGTWVQPVNKEEECKMLMESYPSGDRERILDASHYQVEWDGACKDGKADGLGKISQTNGSLNYFEVTYHDKGVTNQLFYRWTEGTNQVQFGSYAHENKKMVKLLTNEAIVKTDGEIEFVYLMQEHDLITGISKGVAIKKYSDGIAKYIGDFGNLLFFGARESYDPNNKPTYTLWGYYDIGSDKPDNYVILKNQQGIWHQKYQFGNVEELVQLPQNYINSIMKVSNDAAKSANNVSSMGQLALAMKKKYDASKKILASKSPPPPEASKGVSTGTGFFISNDGFVLTNSHVIDGSTSISIILNGRSIPATLIDHDPSNDIALLKVDEAVAGLPIELKKKAKQGTEVAVLGYPNIGLQGNEQKATFGFINANSGIQGDTRYFQISSPIQPGNSGSPMINNQGVVIGIASASLNQSAAIKTTGTLAQNVNYAVKIAYALPMLISHGVDYIEPVEQKPLEKTELIEGVSNSVVLVIAE